MDTKEKLLGQIEERLTVYASWISQGGGIRSDASEGLYCDLLNTAMDYDLQNMNWVEDNFPAIDLGDDDERLAVQVTSTGTAEKVRKTLTRFYAHQQEQHYDRLIVLIAGKAECKPGRFDHPGVELEIWGTAELMQQFRKLPVKKLREVDEFLRERVDAPLVRRPVLHLPVPERRNPVGFLGRKKELDWIKSELKAGTKPVVVAGLGGVGKTALAVQFAKKHWKGQVYFAAFKDTFTRTLADSVGQAIPVEERRNMDEKQTAALALSYLNRCEPGDLLILDNAEVTGKNWRELTQDPFYEKLRRLPMAILVTTRHRDTGGTWLGSLERDELRQIFRGHAASISEAEMDRLIDAVDGHTMMVDMIARTLRESWGDVTPEDIRAAIESSTLHEGDYEEIENDHDPEQRQIYAHLRALFDLSGISEDGCQALRCATLLPQGGMDAKLFRSALTEGAAKEIKKLEKRGWVDLKDGLVSIHPVVRLVCKTELVPTKENCDAFLVRLWNQYDSKQYDKDRIRQLAEAFSTAADDLEDQIGACALFAGRFWKELGETRNALGYVLQAVTKMEQNWPDSEGLSAAYNNAALSYSDLGEHNQALEYMLKALAIDEKVQSPNNISLAIPYNNLGLIYRNLGDYSLSLKYTRKAQGIFENVLPPGHPDIATTHNNIGLTYNYWGNYNRALEHHRKALEILENALPSEHPDFAVTYNNMGLAFAGLGDYNCALEYYQKAFAIQERTLPINHPYNAMCCGNIAWAYYKLEEYQHALSYMCRAVEIAEQSLTEEHPDLSMYRESVELFERKARKL